MWKAIGTTNSQVLHYEMVQDAVNSSALVRSRKYNKERGQLMSHSRKNSLLFDMRAHVLRRRRTADRADNMQWINSLFAIYILSGLYGRPGFHFVYLSYVTVKIFCKMVILFNSAHYRVFRFGFGKCQNCLKYLVLIIVNTYLYILESIVLTIYVL